MRFWRLNIGIYAVVWSLIIGMLTAAYLNLVNWVIDLVPVIIVVALLVGQLVKRFPKFD
ncbi:hypothetical protein [Limosilactobacillus balticus]|uniref:hypothetical protein n=1 Tax=Limosilactobacillus balticus TaxID=2759747 RepID=UPI001E44E3DB|nr:hypothetical protein [Limosilactobacillus balticus]MCD7131629.1 hypothetical protein [Limosilactobacillus balticus]